VLVTLTISYKQNVLPFACVLLLVYRVLYGLQDSTEEERERSWIKM